MHHFVLEHPVLNSSCGGPPIYFDEKGGAIEEREN
jgi:hypothetical protein